MVKGNKRNNSRRSGESLKKGFKSHDGASSRSYLRVMRGMVFSYDLGRGRVDKNSDPTITIGDKDYPDHTQYGKRDWLVVSNNTGNGFSPTCNIVPITSADDKSYIPTHVNYVFQGVKLTILCEQVQTVNTVELSQYRCVLGPEIMDKVDEALRCQFDIPVKYKYMEDAGSALDKISDIIEGIIKSKVEENIPIKKVEQVDIEDAVLRMAEQLEVLYSGKTSSTEVRKVEKEVDDVVRDPEVVESVESIASVDEVKIDDTATEEPETHHEVKHKEVERLSQIDKFYKKYPGCKKEDSVNSGTESQSSESEDVHTEVAVKGTKSKEKKARSEKWTVESCKEFLNDFDVLPVAEVAKKWGYDTITKAHQMKYYVKNKLAKLEG